MNKLSFCIPAYNYAQYLTAAIESVISNGFHVIVVDNCSSDETPYILDKFAGNERVEWVRNPRVLPIQENWNFAVSLVKSDWVKLLQADDFLLPGAGARLRSMIESYDYVDFIGHYCEVIDGSGSLIRSQEFHGHEVLSLDMTTAVREKLKQVYRFKEPSCNLFRKAAWQRVGGYPSDRRFNFDLYFNFRLVTSGRSVLVPERLVAVRRHAISDGANLPVGLALSEAQMLAQEMLRYIGSGRRLSDVASATGWVQFRALELLAQRIKMDGRLRWLKFLSRVILTFLNPLGWAFALRLIGRRLLRGDLQGRYRG